MIEPTPESRRLAVDSQQIREGILAVTLNWSHLESSLSIVLESLVNDHKAALGFAIYFTPNNAETRFEIVNNALRSKIAAAPIPPDLRASIDAEWAFVKLKLDRVRKVRNKITHGSVTTIYQNGKNHIRLAPAMFDFSRIMNQRKGGQIPGMSARDVLAAAQRISDIAKHLDPFFGLVRALAANDENTLRETVRELEARRRRFDGQT